MYATAYTARTFAIMCFETDGNNSSNILLNRLPTKSYIFKSIFTEVRKKYNIAIHLGEISMYVVDTNDILMLVYIDQYLKRITKVVPFAS